MSGKKAKMMKVLIYLTIILFPINFSWAQHCDPSWTPEYSCMEGCGGCGGGSNSGGGNDRAAQELAAQQQAQMIAEQQRKAAIEALNNQGLDAYKNKNWTTAIKFFKQALAYEPDNPVYLRNLAICIGREGEEAYRDGNYASALNDFQEALAGDPLTDTDGRAVITSDITNTQEKIADGQQQQQQQAQDKIAAGKIQQSLQGMVNTMNTAPTSNGLDFMESDTKIVDARNIQSNLPKSVDNAIASAYSNASPEVSERVRKGFQAVMNHDWKLAQAWFGDALNHDPSDAGLKAFAELADYKVANPPLNKSNLQLPKDSDVEFLFPGSEQELINFKNVSAKSPAKSLELPSESDIDILFPNQGNQQIHDMNEYMVQQALADAENDPVLKKLSGNLGSNNIHN